MPTEATKKLFTVDEYYRIAEAGVLSERVHTELIEGEIIEMSPMGSRHAAAIMRANRLFVEAFKDQADIRVQMPLPVSNFSEPEPDLCVVTSDLSSYETRHPGPSDVFLVLEISDSSLRYDRDVKLPVYAAAGVTEVWIEDLPNRILHVFREPSGRKFKTALQFAPGDSVSLLAFPRISFPISSLISPA
jgi:Uma2 family endonuclease